MNNIWETVSSNVFENIYIPAAQTGASETFNTAVDIKLRQWAESTLPSQSVECGWESLKLEFQKFMHKASEAPEHDDIFDQLKQAVVSEAMKRHQWEDKASDMLKVIQLNTLEDRTIPDKRDWDQAVRFLEASVKEKLKESETHLQHLLGPSAKERWLYWKYQSDVEGKRNQVKNELDRILYANEKHPPILSYDELTTIRNNLQRNSLEVDNDFVREVWDAVYRRHFLNKALGK